MNEVNPLKKYSYTLIIFLAAISISASAAKKPKWVKQRPVDPEFYIGIGTSFKIKGEVSYRQEARNKALKELSSEIKVNISSNSILRQFEDNYQIQEQYEAQTSQTIDATLEGYEVFTWENRNEYWVMLKLNKEKYALRKKMKLDYAKKLSATYYYEGRKEVQKGNVFQGLHAYIQAIKAIKNHLHEDLSHKDIEGSVNLGIDISLAIQETFKNISLNTEKPSYLIEFSKEMELPLRLSAHFTNKQNQKIQLSDLPIRFEFVQGDGELNAEGVTDRSGMAHCTIKRLISKRKNQEILAYLNMDKLFKAEDEETQNLLDAFFHKEFIPKTKFVLEVRKSSAYLDITEIVFGKETSSGTFGNILKSELAQSFFNISNNEASADFIVKINTEFVAVDEKKGKGYSLFIVYCNFNMSIVDNKTNLEIFADGFSGLKGMQPGSFEYALKNAMQKAKSKIIDEILPKMEQVNL